MVQPPKNKAVRHRRRSNHYGIWKLAFEELETRCLLAFSVIGSDVFSTGGLRLVADFDRPVNPNTVEPADLVVNGFPVATSATLLDADTVEFNFPALGAGTHAVTIPAGAILDSLGTGLNPYSKSFAVASAAQFTMKHNPRLQPGNAPLVGYAGSQLDRVDILWQTIPASTGTQDSFTVEYRRAGLATWQLASLNAEINTGVQGRVVRSATITGLSWNSDYEYRVRQRRADVIVGQYQSLFHTRLAAGDDTPFSFAAYGDSADGEATGFREVQARINQFNPSFAVLLGDNVYRSGTHPESDSRFNPVVNPEAAAWMAGHIDYLGLGNHDVNTLDGLPSEQNYSVPIPVAGVTAPFAPPATERPEHNYSWDYGDVHFVTFDTNSLTDTTRLDEQLKWVIADLNASAARWKIVYGHHPIAGAADKDENPGDNYYQQVVNRLKAAGVDLFMTGHSHTYSWTYPLTGQINGEATYIDHGEHDHFHAREGLPQLVSGVGGKEVRPGDYSQYPFVAAGFSEDTPIRGRKGFSKVDVTQNTLTVSYIAADNGEVIDSFQIEKEFTQTTSLQHGVNGYSGIVDTILRQNSPDANNATAATLMVDNNEPTGTGHDVQALLRFDNLFDNGPGTVPSTATLRTAVLQLQVNNGSTDDMNLHRMLVDWSDTETWNSLASGVQTNGVEAVASPDISSGQSQVGPLTFDVLASLQAWQANPATNFGWALIPTGNDGIEFDSSEGTIKPKLIVTYLQEAPVLSLTVTLNANSVAENGGTINGAITRHTPDLSLPLTIDLSSSDTSEAIAPSKVTIAAHQSSASFTITVVDDNVLDGTQTVAITGSSAGFSSGSDSLEVTDHEILTVTIVPASITENGGTATGTVTRSNADRSAALVVNLASSDTSEATVPGTITIAANQASANFVISAIDDSLMDGAQTVIITASAAGYVAGAKTIDVADDGTLVVTIVPGSISENGGSAFGAVTRHNIDISSGLTIQLASSDASEATVPATVSMSANQATVNFAITAVDDTLLDETQTVTITASAAGYLNGSKTADVTDSEALTMTIGAASISENGGTATGTVSRSNSDNSAELDVHLTSSDASEAAVPASVTIPANQSTATFTISAIDDVLLDGTQAVAITGSTAGYVSTSRTVAVSDHETLSVDVDTTSIGENGGAAIGTVTRNNSDTSVAIIVKLASNDTSEATVPATVTIPANQSSANFTITAVNDTLLDGTQTATITVSNLSYVSATKTVEVTDYETLAVEISPRAISENGGSAIGTVSRSNANNSTPLIVSLSSSDTGEATVPELVTIPAFQAVTNFIITGVDDESLDGVKSVTITASATGFVAGTQDINVADDGTVVVVLNVDSISESGGSTIGTVIRNNFDISSSLTVNLVSSDTSEATVPATVTILANQVAANFTVTPIDDTLLDGTQTVTVTASAMGYVSGFKTVDVTDSETLGLSIGVPSVSENGTIATGTVTRGNSDNSVELTVNLVSSDSNEAAVPATVTMPANEASAIFTITPVDDALLDGLKIVTIMASAAGYIRQAKTLSVTDHETLTITVIPEFIDENGGIATGTVTRSNTDISEPLVVNLTNTDTSETSVPGSVTIPANQSTVHFAIAAVDDALLDGTQTSLLTAAAGGYVSGTDNIQVTDHETLTVMISLGEISENGGIAAGTVTRSTLNNAVPLVVNLSSSDTTEATVPATVTIAANQVSANFAVTAVKDPLDGTQSVTITASAANYSDGSQTIHVTDVGTLVLTINLSSISEVGGSAIGTVTRDNFEINSDLVVSLASNDTSEATVPKTVTIPANQMTADFIITAVDDNLFDGTRTATISATADQHTTGLQSIDVTDHEMLSLSISPLTMSERGGIAIGTVTRNNVDRGQTLSVTLDSTDSSELIVPTNVFIIANQQSATFVVRAADDTLLDGTQTSVVTASAVGYVPGMVSLNVTDFEALTLTLNAVSISESGGSATGTVTRNNSDLGQPLVVDLTGNDSTEAAVPVSVTIPANQSSANFNIAAVDDAILDGRQTVSIHAVAAGYDPVFRTLDVTDLEGNPIITSPNRFAVVEHSTVVGTVTATDPDPPPQDLRFAIVGGADRARLSIDSQTGELRLLVPPDFESPDDVGANRTFELMIEVRDGTGLLGTQSLQVDITPLNDHLPRFTSLANASVNENTTAVLVVAATDDDLPAQAVDLTIGGGADASQFRLNASTGELAFVDPPDFELPLDSNGDNEYEVQIEAVDSEGGKVTQDLRVTVRGVNEPPALAAPGNQRFDELTPFRLSLAGSDPDGGELLTYVLVSGNQPGMTLAPTGEFQWTTTEAQDGVYSVEFQVRDRDGSVSPIREITIQVDDVNLAPVLTSLVSRTVAEQSLLELTLSATDSDRVAGVPNPVTFAIKTGNQPGMTLDSTTGLFRWTPSESQDGELVLVLIAQDGIVESAPQSLTITVTESNQAPTLTNPGAQSLDEQTEIVVALSATDNDVIAGVADPIRYAIVSGSLPGMTLNSSTGEFRWTPSEVQDVDVPVVFQAIDSQDATSVAQTMTLTVREVNAAPILTTPPDVVSDEQTLLTFSLLAADGDVSAGNADTVTFALLSPDEKLTGLTLNRDTGAFRWLPDESQDGVYSLVFQATDNHNQTSTQHTMTVTVVEQNEAPVLNDPGEQSVTESAALLVTLTATDTDRINGVADTVTYELVSGQLPGMTLDLDTGAFRWTPDATRIGRHVVVFQAVDQQGLPSNQQSVAITVGESNRPPTAISLLAASVDENATGAVIGRLQVTDPDVGQTHSFTIDDARFAVVDQQLQLKPSVQLDFETEPQVVIVVTARDPGTPPQSVSGTFTVTVRDVNDPPRALQLSSQTALENLAGLVIGTLSVDEQDADQEHTFTVMDPRFEVVGNELRLKSDQALNLEEGGEVVLEIIAHDNGTPEQTLSLHFVLSILANARPWQNQAQAHDVTRDGRVVPLDALNVINLLNNPIWLGAGGQLPDSRPANSQLSFYDVNGDGFCTPNDALRIINTLNNSTGEGEDPREWVSWILQAATGPIAIAPVGGNSVGFFKVRRDSTMPAVCEEVVLGPIQKVVLADEFDAKQDPAQRQCGEFESLIDDLAVDICRRAG